MATRSLPVVRTDVGEIRKLYAALDDTLIKRVQKGRDEGYTIPCKSGCDACCYDVALMTQFEIVPIVFKLRTLPKAKLKIIKVQLELWVGKMKAAGIHPLDNEPEIRAYHRAHAACPFLDLETHGCKIYAERPFSCRGHYVINEDPSHCANRANEPTITCMLNEELLGDAVGFMVGLHYDKESKGDVGIVFHMLPGMLLRAWPLIENPRRSIVDWLTAISTPNKETGDDEVPRQRDGHDKEVVDRR